MIEGSKGGKQRAICPDGKQAKTYRIYAEDKSVFWRKKLTGFARKQT
jgi:hypothetical protein